MSKFKITKIRDGRALDGIPVHLGDIHARNVALLKLHSAVEFGQMILASKEQFRQTSLSTIIAHGVRILVDKTTGTNHEILNVVEDLYQKVASQLEQER